MSGEAGEMDLHRNLKLFAVALVAIMNFFYPWQRRCKNQPGMKPKEVLGRLFYFFPQPASSLFKPQFTPAILIAMASVNPTTSGVHIPAPGKCLNTHTPPAGRSSFYLLISKPEGSAVSSYADIFMEAGELSFITRRAVIVSVTCSHNTGVQHDT